MPRPWNKWAYLRGGAPTDRQTAAETCLRTWVTRRVWKSLGQPPENCGNAHSHFPQNVCWVMKKRTTRKIRFPHTFKCQNQVGVWETNETTKQIVCRHALPTYAESWNPRRSGSGSDLDSYSSSGSSPLAACLPGLQPLTARKNETFWHGHWLVF